MTADERPLTLTVPAKVLDHVLALAILGAREYLADKHQGEAERDIDVVIDEVRSAKKGYEVG